MNMKEREDLYSRRNVIAGAGASGAALLLGQSARAAEAAKDTSAETQASIPEDLMRQHAVAGRLLIIYGLATNPQADVTPPSMKALASTAQMLRSTGDRPARAAHGGQTIDRCYPSVGGTGGGFRQPDTDA
jgi:hypothetical protein